MRIAPAFAVCAALLAPTLASANPKECENLGREIQRYQTLAERASDGGNPRWEEHMKDQVGVLEARQAQRCSAADVIATTNQCRDFTARIDHYEAMAARAEDLGNPQWAAQARYIAEQLDDERSERCPEWSPQAKANRAFMKMLKTAGQMALTYFTMGAY
jgi:hypothetical protein